MKIKQISANKCIIKIPAHEYAMKWIWINQVLQTFGGRKIGPGYTYEIPATFTQIEKMC